MGGCRGAGTEAPGCRCFTDTATVPEMESWLTGTTEATNCVQAALVAGVGLLALIDVCKNRRLGFFSPNVSVTTNAQGRALAHLCSWGRQPFS